MALHSLLEVALHFDSFRNVDLFHQGLYHLKARLYREIGDERLMAIPYGCTTCPTLSPEAKPKSSRTDHHNLIPAHIMEEEHNTFSTRSFLIRYCEEEVELNDLAMFRFELTSELMQESAPLTLEVDLMFADLTQHGGADRFGEQPDVDSTEFKSVCTQVFRLHGAEQGLHEYCPIVFDEFHFCVANLCIHSTLLDVRFRLQPQVLVPSRPRITNAKGETARNGAQVDEAVAMNAAQKTGVPASQNAALTLTECMFGNCNGGGREQLLLATEAFYQKHLKVLANSYAGLVAWYKVVAAKCLTDSHREALGESVDEPKPQLTGCDLLSLPPNGSLQHWLNGTGQTGQGPSFKTYLTSQLSIHANEKDFARHVAVDMNVASCQILGLWHKVLNVMLYSCHEVTCLLRTKWEQRSAVQWTDIIHRQPVHDNIMAAVPDVDDLIEPENHTLNLLQKAQGKIGPKPILLEDMTLAAELQPILFEQGYVQFKKDAMKGLSESRLADLGMPPSAPKEYRGVHLFVLVHGFQGNSFDMRLFKNNLALVYPDAIFLVSSSNEDNTDGDLNEMGIRLAQEVVNFITDWCPGSSLGRLSFVGYSIGGVIVRSALPLLHEYHHKLYTYLSLSCCHFGFMDQQSPLFNTAVWALTKWRKCALLEQLALRDTPELKDTCMAKLSKAKGLEYFQHICLLSSRQDNYSPSKSSRMEMDPAWEKSSSKDVYANMVKALWGPVNQERVLRIRTHFDLPEKNVDAAIGRVAHIRFIECQPVMRMLIHSYSYLFR